MASRRPVYKRIVLKLSGEALQGRKYHGIDQPVLISISRQIKEIRDLKVDVAIVLGAGNIFRGQENTASRGLDMDRSVADYMGMLATVINGLALQNALGKNRDADARYDRDRYGSVSPNRISAGGRSAIWKKGG